MKSKNLYSRVKEFIQKNRLIESGEKVILGVSGGPDSVFLLRMFIELRQELKVEFVVAHLNHCLRKESDSEEEFVKDICVKSGIEIINEHKRVKDLHRGDSLEQTARKIRYDFFSKVSRKYKCKKIVLAHHKDDLVETVVLRLLRGTGLKGLRGILPYAVYENLIVVRPLLSITKKEILDYLKKNNISFVVDKSNSDQSFLRNKVRHTLIPQLESISHSVKNNIYKLSQNIVRDYDFIGDVAMREFKKMSKQPAFKEVYLDLDKLSRLHKALSYHIIRLSIQESKGNLKRVDSKHIEEIFSLIEERPKGSIVDIPGAKILKDRKYLKFMAIK